jgi:hypothetical protein
MVAGYHGNGEKNLSLPPSPSLSLSLPLGTYQAQIVVNSKMQIKAKKKKKSESLSPSPSVPPVPSTNCDEQQGVNQSQKKIRASLSPWYQYQAQIMVNSKVLTKAKKKTNQSLH